MPGLSDFQVHQTLGKGAFASVYKVTRKSDGKVYALKRVKINKMGRREISDALNEIRLLSSMKVKGVVSFFEAFLHNKDTELCIIMEFCGSGDLSGKIERYKKRRQYINERVIWTYASQLLEAIHFLHSHGILHRDIKAANCFLAEDGSVRLGDLNVSKRLKGRNKVQTQIGTPYYMSPEIWSNQPYDGKSDIWAFGCLIYELAALRPPFTGTSLESLRRSVLSGRYPAIPRVYSTSLSNFIQQCLVLNPSRRADIDRLLAFPEIQRTVCEDTVTSFSKENQHMNLISTIQVPRNMKNLPQALPKPCYPDVRPNSPDAWTLEDQIHERKKLGRGSSSGKGEEEGEEETKRGHEIVRSDEIENRTPFKKSPHARKPLGELKEEKEQHRHHRHPPHRRQQHSHHSQHDEPERQGRAKKRRDQESLPIAPRGSMAQVKREARREVNRYSKRPQYRGYSNERKVSHAPSQNEPSRAHGRHQNRSHYPSKYGPSPYENRAEGRERRRPGHRSNNQAQKHRLW